MSKKNSEIKKFLKHLCGNNSVEKLGTNSGNRTAPIHRWFSFLPGFSHSFVKSTFEFFHVARDNYLVFDPFIGTATTAVVGRQMGVNVIGNETNRFLYKISKAKISLSKKPELLNKIRFDVLKCAKNKWNKKTIDEENPLLLRCYSRNNLKKLITLRDICHSKLVPPNYRSLIFVTISAILPKCSNVGISIPYVSWHHTRVAEEPFRLFGLIIDKITKDLVDFSQNKKKSYIRIFLHDSRIINSKIKKSSVNLVFTSPPYLNNFDYGEALKVYTYFWGLTKNWHDITKKIRRKSLTSATTYYTESKFVNKTPEEIFGDKMLSLIPKTTSKIIKKIDLISKAKNKNNRKKSFDILTALYFKDMFQCIQEMYRVLKDGCLAFVIIGDSAPYGVYVPTDKILGEMAVESGFSDSLVKTLRPRGYKWLNLTYRHKIRLRESLLILQK